MISLAHWAMTNDPEAVNAASEAVTLADGVADQALVPGVAPVSPVTRATVLELQRRQARRGNAALPCGGLWDETAQQQGSLF